MFASLLLKTLIFLLLAAIFISLAGGLFFLAKDKGQSRRTIYSLTVRITLSVCLFLLLLIGYMTGLLQPHSVLPAPHSVVLPAQKER
jgi:cytochrome bd-type quinol oxidase subunit 2